jgi:hypothetical protein
MMTGAERTLHNRLNPQKPPARSILFQTTSKPHLADQGMWNVGFWDTQIHTPISVMGEELQWLTHLIITAKNMDWELTEKLFRYKQYRHLKLLLGINVTADNDTASIIANLMDFMKYNVDGFYLNANDVATLQKSLTIIRHLRKVFGFKFVLCVGSELAEIPYAEWSVRVNKRGGKKERFTEPDKEFRDLVSAIAAHVDVMFFHFERFQEEWWRVCKEIMWMGVWSRKIIPVFPVLENRVAKVVDSISQFHMQGLGTHSIEEKSISPSYYWVSHTIQEAWDRMTKLFRGMNVAHNSHYYEHVEICKKCNQICDKSSSIP